jgi:antitoxin (DNA-binding transcriptional repressor) of toxin-antitoxin stability system
MTIKVTILQANEQFSQLLKLVLRGEEIAIYNEDNDNIPVAHITPNPSNKPKRIPGQDRGKIFIAPDFNAPLDDEILADFIGE